MNPPLVRILAVVDHDATSAQALSAFFGARGFHVWLVHSGAAALSVLRSESIDGLIIDFRLPDVRGDVLASAAFAIQPRLVGRAVFLTADQGDVATEALRDLRCPVVRKPVALDALERILRDAIGDPSAIDADAR